MLMEEQRSGYEKSRVEENIGNRNSQFRFELWGTLWQCHHHSRGRNHIVIHPVQDSQDRTGVDIFGGTNFKTPTPSPVI